MYSTTGLVLLIVEHDMPSGPTTNVSAFEIVDDEYE